MKNRLWSILLALCMVLSLLPFGAMTASAADMIESGACGFAGKKYDDMAKRRNQQYHFMFVHSDGRQLQEISDLFSKLQIRPSVDAVFPLEEADAALKKNRLRRLRRQDHSHNLASLKARL